MYYYPLLRARQFELIALRELAADAALQGLIVPILEPVRDAYNNLTLARSVFLQNNQKAYIIVNPIVGEYTGDGTFYIDYLEDRLNKETYLPAFHYLNNSQYILENIERYSFEDCMILCQSDTDTSDVEFQRLVAHDAITRLTVSSPERNRSLHRYLKGLHKIYIRQDDLFEKQLRNSDFLSIFEHKFSEEHLYFQEEGFDGFSDYTVLPSEYIDGGSSPRAIVIHLTYLHNQDQVWIRHFTSESNDSIANVQGKFAEAAGKAVAFCEERNLSNNAIDELKSYYYNKRYPGLGTVKKISIKNHLLVLSAYLRKKYE
jgi:hypothetical protein